MVLIKRKDNTLFITSSDIIQYNVENQTDIHVTLEQPIIPENLKKSQIDVIEKEVRSITDVEFSMSGNHIVVITENKQIILYDKCFKPLKNILANRTPSRVCFTPSDDILVADKTGDVYLYKHQDEENKPILLLGHLSVILDLAISECGKYIITSDRDEKIRVSHFPNCYNIASYCLGHTEFVNKIKVVKNLLVSASGDGTVRFWNFVSGTQLGIINTNGILEENLLQEFTRQMNNEKVDVFALPITDMQLYLENILYIAISIYNYDFIQLYSVNLDNFNSQLMSKLHIGSPFSFCLCKELFVYKNNLNRFRLVENNFVKYDDSNLDALYDKYSKILNSVDSNSVTVLYKRKFDNVQEYLERKKQRS